MLVLSRKPEQKIKIGDDIELTIIAVSGDTVRIGIEAPRTVRILRSEVFEELCRENNAAVSSSAVQEARSLLSNLSLKKEN